MESQLFSVVNEEEISAVPESPSRRAIANADSGRRAITSTEANRLELQAVRTVSILKEECFVLKKWR